MRSGSLQGCNSVLVAVETLYISRAAFKNSKETKQKCSLVDCMGSLSTKDAGKKSYKSAYIASPTVT